MSRQSRRALLDWYNHFAALIHETRFSLFVVAIAGLAFIVNDQAKDLLQSLDVRSHYTITLVIAVSWCALQGWGWARYILNQRLDNDTPAPVLKDGTRDKLTIAFALILIALAFYLQNVAVLALLYLAWTFRDPKQYLPRFYGVLAYTLAIIAATYADQFVITALLIVCLALFLVFTHKRRTSARLAFLQSISKGTWTVISLAVIAVSMLWSIVDAVSMGWALGAGAVVFAGLGAIIPVGSLVVMYMRKTRIPVLTLLLIYVAAISAFTDNHEVRALEQPAQRIASLQDAYAQWRTNIGTSSLQSSSPQNNGTPNNSTQNNVAAEDAPLVLVATAGGGLRAAYWTALTLGELEHRLPGFHRNVFAISGVSGGSVGAMFYVAALDTAAKQGGQQLDTGKLYETVGQDFLAPVTASMLYGDLAQRFVPVIGGIAVPDRAQTLEKGWERKFKSQFGDDNMQRAFTSFWSSKNSTDNWLPLLFINGTHEESGQRIITTPVAMDKTTFTDALDFFTLHGNRDIRASTAAHNSARFSVVSPAGTLKSGDDVKGHIIDGGYFENNGAETLLDIYSALKPKHRNIIIIAITNDVLMPDAVYASGADPNAKVEHCIVKPASFLNEASAPLLGLLSTRESRGMLAFKRLRESVCNGPNPCDSFFHFNIQKAASNNIADIADTEAPLKQKLGMKQHCVDPPLGWVLSQASRQNMNYQLGITPEPSTGFDLGNCFDHAPPTGDKCANRWPYHNNADTLLEVSKRLHTTKTATAPPQD